MSRKYTTEYKVEAVKLAKEIGNKRAVAELGVPKGTLMTWVYKAQHGELDLGIGQQSPKSGLTIVGELQVYREKIRQLEKDNARLKKENEFLEEASAFFAASRRKSANGKE